MRGKWPSLVGLLLVLVLDLWLRGATIAPTLRDKLPIQLYPEAVGAAEPLDCDEAIYAYIGRRITRGDAMYRDLTENKPPGGYWLNALAVATGGASETTIRLMPIPYVLATIFLVWWIAGRLGGPVAAVGAALIYALMSTDPYLYGNGANMEHFVNLFATASLALMVGGWGRRDRRLIFLAGVACGLGALVKQVAATHLLVYGLALIVRSPGTGESRITSVFGDITAMVAGFLSVWGFSVLILVLQGAGGAAFADVVRYGGALATETPSDPKEYPFAIRWLVGNTDPEGRLPWPFGRTIGRAWWAAGSWPLWLASIPCFFALACQRGRSERRLVAAWTVSAWLQVAAPRLFWQHYYLLPLPGVAVAVGVGLGGVFAAIRHGWKAGKLGRTAISGLSAVSLAGCLIGSAEILRRDYLLISPEEVTTRYKGGGQWVVLRDVGREIKRRTHRWLNPRIFVWGIQSPLYLYSEIDGVTPQIFTDPFIVAHAETEHPLIRERIKRTMRDLEATRPEIMFFGEKPFPALAAFARSGYRPSRLLVRGMQLPITPDGRGLWIRSDRAQEFATFASG